MSDVKAFLDRYAKDSEGAWIIAALTDEYIINRFTPENTVSIAARLSKNAEKVQEIRIFDSTCEHRLLRTFERAKKKAQFLSRSIFDSGERKDPRDHIDVKQYLDIDETKGHSEGYVYTTGGGRYFLPLNNIHNARVLIRYYLEQYPDTGQARVADWRVVDFLEGCTNAGNSKTVETTG